MIRSPRPDLDAVSLVIPIRDEEDAIPQLFSSILAQSRHPDEVLFVDCGSIDGSHELLLQLTGGYSHFRVLEIGPAFPGIGRNRGISAASHEWIALTDAGCLPDPDWLEQLVATALEVPSSELIAGNYEVLIGGRTSRFFWPQVVPAKRSIGPQSIRAPFIASFLLTRRIWAQAGGFPDLRAAEDLLFIERASRVAASAAWAWSPAATVRWEPPSDYVRLFRRTRLYSQVNVQAGLQRRWHYGLLRNYVILGLLGLIALLRSPKVPMLPVSAFALRIGIVLGRHRKDLPIQSLIAPRLFLGTAIGVLVSDLATFLGWLDYFVARRKRDRQLPTTPPTSLRVVGQADCSFTDESRGTTPLA